MFALKTKASSATADDVAHRAVMKRERVVNLSRLCEASLLMSMRFFEPGSLPARDRHHILLGSPRGPPLKTFS